MLLSVVVPCFDEEDVLTRLVEELATELTPLVENFEVIFVDDGSRDSTLCQLREACRNDTRLRYLALSRNFGKESAMLAGLSQARGDAVVLMDADLQHPPSLVRQMLPFLNEGYDQVVARRSRTGEPAVRSFASRAYYRVVNRLVDVRLDDGVGDFRVLSRTAVQALLSLGEYNRFSKGLFAWIGFDTAVVDYDNVRRDGGQSKWSTRALLNYAIDSVLSFNDRPLRLAIHAGVWTTAVAVLYALWVLVDAVVNGNAVDGYVTMICAIVGFGGMQLVLVGLVGEYLGRIYAEVKARPHFLIKESSERPRAPVSVELGPHAEPAVGVSRGAPVRRS